MKIFQTGHKRPRNRKIIIKLFLSNYFYLLINICVLTTLFVNIYGAESEESSTSADEEEPVFSQSARQLFTNENSNENVEKHMRPEASMPPKIHRQYRKNPPPFVLADIQLQCAEGWERFAGKCYKEISIEKSWPQALAFCSRFGAKLVRLESSEENKFLAKYLMRPHLTSGSTTSSSEYWIGLLYRPLMMDSSISSSSSHSQSSMEGSFLWSDGSQTSRYVGFWSYGQPDPANGSCTKILVDGQQVEGPTWQLDVCNQLRPFICEQSACIKGSFFCQNGVCLPERARCNGIDECGDSSDEFNCPTSHSEMSCQRYEKGESGRIETPNFPASYRQGANCRWVIEGPLNSKIQLNFDSFETEERHDLVTVLDGGPSENSTFALSTISGTPRNTEKLSFESSTNRMIVQFRADQSIQARGFQASWRTVPISCGNQQLKASSIGQQFHSPEWPRNYPKGIECVWRIEAPSGQLISLFIEEFNTEAELDFLTIYDGPSPSAPVLAKFSGQMKEPQLIISTQSQVHIYFFSSDTISQKGFTITYKKGCDNNIRRSHGVLTSPGNAHLPYAPSQICRWNIELPPPSQQTENFDVAAEIPSLSLALNSWDVADLGDKLQIYEGGEDGSSSGRPLHESDGFTVNNAPPKTIYAKQGRVELVWRSNVLNSGTGWNISFSTSCPPLALPSRKVLLSTKNTAYGTHVTISCERGFEFATGLGRHFETRCELGGLWSNSAPVPDCQPVYCSAIPQIANGFAVSATNVSYAGMARYQCYEGFSFASGKQHEEIFCTDEGRWTQSPKCKTDACPALPAFVSGERILQFGDGIGFGSVYQFHCAKGYFIEGPLSIVCRPNGEWSSPQPLCKKLTCTDIPVIENGELHLLPSNNGVADEKTKEKHERKQKDYNKNLTTKQKMEFKTKRNTVIRELQFGDSLRVECHSGFQSVGAETLKCLANQTLSGIPKCRDIDECEIQSAGNCAAKSTTCVNMAGGFHCQCQPGYKPKLDCSGPITILPTKIQTSHGVPVPVQQLNSKNGWCADSTITNAQMLERRIMPFNESISSTTSILTLIFTFPVPKIIEKLHLEKVVDPSSSPPSGIAGAATATPEAWPQRFIISYSIEDGMPFEVYNGGLAELGGNNINTTNDSKKSNERKLNNPSNSKEIRTRALGAIGSEILVLAKPLEARTLQIEFLEFHGGVPCMKFEFLGCQRTACEDINECEYGRNGGCEQHCHNTQGGHRCSCEEGFDLFLETGQSGSRLREGETGYGEFDSLRFNHSCIPRHCAPLTTPENGQLIAQNLDKSFKTEANNTNKNEFFSSSFAFPSIVEFRCTFGYQMRGPSHLKCLADGTWNGTAPTCIPATCSGVKNSTAVGLFVQPDTVSIPFGQNLSFVCSQTNRPPKHSALGEMRQCIYDPRTDGLEYWLSGPEIDCPLVDCGPPPALSGAYYEGDEGHHGGNFKVGSVYLFQCRAPYSLVGKSSYDDRMVRCNVDGTWDLGDLRCEGPVCVDPGHPDDGQTFLDSVEEGAVATFSCTRQGFKPFPAETISCSLGTPCVLSEDVGISSGFIPDGAFSDNSDKVIWGYEPHKSRMSSSGWCGSKDAFIFLSVDLQRIYTLTTLRLTGVAGNGHLAGHVTKMQLFYKVQFSQNYDNYPMEFSTPSGNHRKIYQFTLNPPLRARYILLGITEYEKNPCLRFDMHGCLAPLSSTHEVPAHLQVGWNASIPQCIDAEPPTFKNCPQSPVIVQTDENGQLFPANYVIPEATDNSGRITYMLTKPEDFHPPYPVSQDTDIIYQAFDDAGNMAECAVRLRIPDTVPPILKCPDSYAVWAQENQTELHMQFNESSVKLVVQDQSPITQISYEPSEARIKLDSHVTVEASVLDAHSNRNKCKFQIALLPEPCSPWSLRIDEATVQKQCQRHASGTVCQVQCRKGYRFLESFPQQKSESKKQISQNSTSTLPQRYSCSIEQQSGKWLPSPNPPACVPMAMEPARYEMKVHMNYSLNSPLPSDCAKSYELMVGSLFDSIDQVLSQRCSSTVQIYVRFLDAKFSQMGEKTMGANFTVQILPTVLQQVFYELCSLTLRTIFDLRIPGATIPIRSLLALSGDSVPAILNLGCPPINASGISLSQGFSCSQGELLKLPPPNVGADDFLSAAPGLPECFPCPKGTAFVNNSCIQCPMGSYQDQEGKIRCKPCIENTYTLQSGAQSNESCLDVCGNGMFSSTGMIPCQLCPRHTFAGPPPIGGYKECEPCPEGTYTARLGSVGPSHCKQPCAPGHFSVTGLEPCSPCPINFYQPNIGQQRCLQCSNDSFTSETGRFADEHCKKLDCQTLKCQNRGQCVVANHKEVCECRPGFMGSHCEQQIPLCDSHPCLNGGTCELHNGAFRCICPQNYTGSRCQFGPDECISSVHCPNGGVCQDLPGLGTTKCICRTGFTGPDCSQISDPCQSDQPCKNGAQCIPLQLGRYKCKCLPGWEGTNCEKNIDDCTENPCALGAKCHDLINDFECECPHGFSGKRCQIKDNLCDPSPCLNGGQCVDTLFDKHCICKRGWNGTFCEQEVNECSQKPCQNGATCRDQEDDYSCECAPGFHGYQCQYMIDHCAVKPCRNNGTCINRGPIYECQCPLGYEGDHCEHNVDECEMMTPCDAVGTGRCEDLVNGFKCHCHPGYEGNFCEQHVSQCEDDPCMNNGICTDLGAGFQCECQLGWKGDRCQEMETQCDRKPCMNEGKCVPVVDDYFCVCPEGVSGKNCELAPNRCLGEPCHNGGVCGDFGSRSDCQCPKGFSGKGCQFRFDSCHEGLCKNGGTCVNNNNDINKRQMSKLENIVALDQNSEEIGFKCICAPGFTGNECEIDINECQPSPCPLASHCVDLVNGYYCKCPFNMTGANCGKRIDPDYDLHFLESSSQPASASLGIPFNFASSALTLNIWVKFEKNQRDVVVKEQRQSPPVFFTLYSSSSPNQPTNLTELLTISSEAIQIRLFPELEKQPLVLHFPIHQRPDTQLAWNNIIFMWDSQQQGSYSLLWNAVRLYSDKGYAPDRRLDINAWINLGDPKGIEQQQNQHLITNKIILSDLNNENEKMIGSKFVGSITRVNMWNRMLDFETEIPSIVQRCQGSPDLYEGLSLRFANYDRLQGKVERIAKSTCGRIDLTSPTCLSGDENKNTRDHQCRPTSSNMNDYSNKEELVEVEGCPVEPIYVQTPLKELNISWKEPKFYETSSRVLIANIEQNLKPGQVFTWGQYSAIYVALDNQSSPLAICQFKINVVREFCPDPEIPVNGVQRCEQWGPGLRYKACSVHCQNGYGFSRPPAAFYSCGEDGKWRPNEGKQRPFRYPQCTRQSPAKHLARIQLSYPQLALCNPAGKSTVTEKINERINQINNKWHICANNDESSECPGVQVQINCQDIFASARFRRQNRQTTLQQFDVIIDVPIRERPLLGQMDPTDIIRDEAMVHGLFSLEQVIPNGRPDIGAFRVGNAFRCPVGYLLYNGSCVPCAPGTFFFVPTGECELCPIGQYQPEEAQIQCIECPSESPITVGMGAVRQNECRIRCLPGHHLNISTGLCEPCSYGFFQPESGAFDCIPCGIGKTTLERTAINEDQCRDECPDGQQLTASGSCQPCPQGMYRTRGQDKQCVECPSGTTTEGVGAGNKALCNTPKCGAGQFLIADIKRCQFCPRGTFQDQQLQFECKKCPPSFNTAEEGATRESQCYSTDQCSLGQDNCSWNAQCIDLPDENDVASWRCVCNPGFRGNGINCTDACLNFCLNDGICRKNKLGHVECACKENFSGERCEIRFQPRSQKLVYWTGAIVAVVFLLIVIVVVIWMISLRFSRSSDNSFLSSPLDKPALSFTQSTTDSPLASNFLYGRPPPILDRSHSSSIGGGGSNSIIHPIGFYYEDEQSPYDQTGVGAVGRHGRENSQEMKSIFLASTIADNNNEVSAIGDSSASHSPGGHQINNGGIKATGTTNTTNSSGGSPGSATRALEQRLRHIQQHMYRPMGDS